MNLKTPLQENLLVLLCWSDQHAKQVRNLTTPNQFDGIYRDIASKVMVYIDQFQKPPKNHLPDLFTEELDDPSPRSTDLEHTLFSIHSLKDEVNPEFILKQIGQFVRIKSLQDSIIAAADTLREDDPDSVEQVEQIFQQATTTQLQVFDPGIRFGTPQSLNFLTNPNETYMSGIPELDRLQLGPTKGELHLFMAPTNRGKTWWLINLAKYALAQRKNVLHITLEVSEKIVAQRYNQAFFGISKRQVDKPVTHLDTDREGRFIGFQEKQYHSPFLLSDKDVASKLMKEYKKVGPKLQRLMIKEFPSGSLTVPHLEAYLDMLETGSKFRPDIILLDYIDLMDIDGERLRTDTGRTYVKIRGLAQRRDLAMCSVTQSNRQSTKLRIVGEDSVSEDYSKLQTADVCISFSQTENEYQKGLARLFVVKARNELAKFTILISQNYDAGQFCLSSTLMEKKYWDIIEPRPKKDGDPKEKRKPRRDIK